MNICFLTRLAKINVICNVGNDLFTSIFFFWLQQAMSCSDNFRTDRPYQLKSDFFIHFHYYVALFHMYQRV